MSAAEPGPGERQRDEELEDAGLDSVPPEDPAVGLSEAVELSESTRPGFDEPLERAARVRAVLNRPGAVREFVSVSGVARAAEVPRWWLYAQPGLRTVVDAHRRRVLAARAAGVEDDETGEALASAEQAAGELAGAEGPASSGPAASTVEGSQPTTSRRGQRRAVTDGAHGACDEPGPWPDPGSDNFEQVAVAARGAGVETPPLPSPGRRRAAHRWPRPTNEPGPKWGHPDPRQLPDGPRGDPTQVSADATAARAGAARPSTGADDDLAELDVADDDDVAAYEDVAAADEDGHGYGAEDTEHTEDTHEGMKLDDLADGAAQDGPDGPVDGVAARRAVPAAESAGWDVGWDVGLRSALARGPWLTPEDADAAIAAGVLAQVRTLTDPRRGVAAGAGVAGTEAAQRSAARSRAVARARRARGLGDAPDWLESAGRVLPVLGGSSGVGASVFAAALFDALDAAGVAVLLVDAADPSRSGLALACSEGPAFREPAEGVAISYGRRGGGYLTHLVTSPTEVLTAGMVPDPRWWLPSSHPPEVTIVDVGWDAWALAAHPLRGPGAWLENSPSTPANGPVRPVLVCAPSRPSVTLAEQVLVRMLPWTRSRQVVEPAGLVVSGATRWPRGASGAGGRELARLGPAWFLPHHHEVAVAGVGPEPVPLRLQRAAARFARDWGLM